MNRPPQSLLAQVFYSADERRLRAGWRLLIQTLLLLVILSGITIPLVIVGAILGFDVFDLQALSLLDLIPTAIAMTASVWIARRLLDRRSFSSLGLHLDRRALRDLLVGFLIAGMVMGTIYAVEACAGWLRFDGWAWQTIPTGQIALGLGGGLFGFTLVGFYEELLSRGYHLQNIRDGMGLRWGLFLSSVIFALMHIENPNAVWYSTLPGLVAAGYFLAYGWIRTRQLWLPIGVHIGWNFFEGSILGFPVSGLNVAGLIDHTPMGPIAITGGSFGPEAGLIALPAMAIGFALIWLYTRRRIPASHP